jgi:hypothetical protein
MRSFIAIFLLMACGSMVRAQQAPLLRLDQRPPVTFQGDTLLFPWTGGFNSIIPVELDFDGDAVMDLFFFDRVGNRITPFKNTGDTAAMPYRYMPEWTNLLPPFHDWVRSADFDCDGDMDLFSYTNAAIGVWRNDFSPGFGLTFTPVVQQLPSWYGSFQNPIFVSQVNLPALVDVDGDTDLDIITFSSSSNYLEYHRNYAIDSAGTCNAFRFSLEPYCWGYFKLSGLSNTGLLNQSCRSGVLDSAVFSARRHAGSVLTPMDQDCDGDVDLLNGDILGENMLFLLNGGTPDSAIITQQDINFPVYDVPVMMQNLPGAYYIDLNNDQQKDMLVSPFATVGEDFNNLHCYQNTTDNCSNIFQLTDTQFVGRQTIDLGTASSPVLFDVDNDGLQDVVVGNELYFNTDPGLTYSRLAWLRNVGSVSAPSFEMVDRDWLGLSSLQQYGLAPEFGDVDADGDADLLLGNADGTLILYSNVAGAGQAPQFVFNAPAWQGIDIGNNSQPQLIDVDRDGRMDLLIGERSGVLNYYRNISPSGPALFSLVSSNFGAVNVLQPGGIAGYSDPYMYDSPSGYQLLVGCDNGSIYHFVDIDSNLGGSFLLADSVYSGIQELKRITIARADLDGDGNPDLMAGCNAGGIRFYSSTSTAASDTDQLARNAGIMLYPNPAESTVRIALPSGNTNALVRVRLLDLHGQSIREFSTGSNELILDLTTLPSGVYFVEAKSEIMYSCKRLVKQ